MLVKYYGSVFIAKIIVGVLASIWFLRYWILNQREVVPMVVFVVDMQESMATQDVFDHIWLAYTRQQTAIEYISQAIKSIATGTNVGIVRLGYYPDYIVPLTRDRKILAAYVTSLSNAPLSPILIYETWWISLEDYYAIAPDAKYILLTDKQSTITSVDELMPTVQNVFIDPTSNRATIKQREDTMQTFSYRQWWHLWWIFVLITIVWLVLL